MRILLYIAKRGKKNQNDAPPPQKKSEERTWKGVGALVTLRQPFPCVYTISIFTDTNMRVSELHHNSNVSFRSLNFFFSNNTEQILLDLFTNVFFY